MIEHCSNQKTIIKYKEVIYFFVRLINTWLQRHREKHSFKIQWYSPWVFSGKNIWEIWKIKSENCIWSIYACDPSLTYNLPHLCFLHIAPVLKHGNCSLLVGFMVSSGLSKCMTLKHWTISSDNRVLMCMFACDGSTLGIALCLVAEELTY